MTSRVGVVRRPAESALGYPWIRYAYAAYHLLCGGPAVLLSRPLVGRSRPAELCHVDGRQVNPFEEMRCDSCGYTFGWHPGSILVIEEFGDG